MMIMLLLMRARRITARDFRNFKGGGVSRREKKEYWSVLTIYTKIRIPFWGIIQVQVALLGICNNAAKNFVSDGVSILRDIDGININNIAPCTVFSAMSEVTLMCIQHETVFL